MVERGRERERESGSKKRLVSGRWPDLSNITGNIGTRLFRDPRGINTRMRGGFIPRGYPSISKLYDSRQLGTESGINSLGSARVRSARSRFESATRDSDRNFLRYHLLTTSLCFIASSMTSCEDRNISITENSGRGKQILRNGENDFS